MAKIELLSITENAEKHIELCGRTCYKSYDKITNTSAAGFVKGIINRGHLSVIEHASASVKITEVSRSFTHQLVRHRHNSFSQESQRYVTITVTNPDWYIIPESIAAVPALAADYHSLMQRIAEVYEILNNSDIPKEDARFVLPNACKTEIVVSGNFRCWFELFQKRIDSHAQWEIYDAMNQVRAEFEKYAPTIFSKEYFGSK